MNLRKAHNKRFSRTQVVKAVTLGVLVIGLLFGLQQAQTNQDIKKSKASYCGMCSPSGACECANNKQTGYKCKYVPPECNNNSLGYTWQPDPSCTANAACGTGGGGGGRLTPTSPPSLSCTGRKPTTSCNSCGGQSQVFCGVGNNSTTCNCNNMNAPCDPWLFALKNGYCAPVPSGPFPTPTPIGSQGKGNPKPSPTSTHERAPTPRPKPTR